MTTKTFAPSILLEDGTTYEPRGWEWILAFALDGCDWAVKKACAPGFREAILKDLKESEGKETEDQIDWHLEKIEVLRKKLKISKFE